MLDESMQWEYREAAAQGVRRATLGEVRALWSALIRRQAVIKRTFIAGDCERLIIGRRSAPIPPPLSERNLRILEKALLGIDRKVIAFDFAISASTVAQVLKCALNEMGLACSPARAPLGFIMLVRAAFGEDPPEHLFLDAGGAANTHETTLTAVLNPLGVPLAPAERAVLAERLRGKSYADIAADRKVSIRTIANQIAAAYRRLGASGRFGLLEYVSQT